MGKPIPIVQSIGTRSGSLATDSYMQNFYAEPDGSGGLDAVLRPGLSLAAASPALAAGSIGLGMTTTGVSGAIAVFYNSSTGNDTVYLIFPATGGTVHAIPSVTNVGLPYFLLSINTASNGDFQCFQGAGANGLWTTGNAGFSAPVKVTAADYPTNQSPVVSTVPGTVYLDGTFYVMTSGVGSSSVSGGLIYNSTTGGFDPTTWSGSFVVVDAALGSAVALCRHLNYVVALMSNGISFFYDAGTAPPASALSIVPNCEFQVGCASAYSVAHVNQLTIFMSKGQAQRGRSIMAFSGLSLVKLSDNYIDKILDSDTLATGNPCSAYGINLAGHSFYVLNLANSNLTLVFDIDLQRWHLWATGTGPASFTGWYYAASPGSGKEYVQGLNDGQVYQFNSSIGTDNGTNITGTIITDEYGQGYTLIRCPTLSIVGDTVARNVNVSYSDDDYQTWSTPVSVAMQYIRKQITRLGSFRRRAFNFTYTGGLPIRLNSFFIGKVADEDE